MVRFSAGGSGWWMQDFDLIQFMIGGVDIAIQHIRNQGQAAPGMVEGDDGIGEEIDAIRDLCPASFSTPR